MVMMIWGLIGCSTPISVDLNHTGEVSWEAAAAVEHAPPPGVSFSGTCPGTVDLTITATPGSTVALLSGDDIGSDTLSAATPCPGLNTGLSAPVLVDTFSVGPSGVLDLSSTLSGPVCDAAVSVVEAGGFSCSVSPPVWVAGGSPWVDTDGDGWSDAEEADQFTDPMNPMDHPYTGGWDIDGCRDAIVPTGDDVGDVAENFALPDQYGDEVKLHDFCDRTVLLVSTAAWCGPCIDREVDFAQWYRDYEDMGLMVISLVGENVFGGTPNQGELADWSDASAGAHPAVADDGWGVTQRYVPASFAIPTNHLIGPGGVILVTDEYLLESDIAGYL